MQNRAMRLQSFTAAVVLLAIGGAAPPAAAQTAEELDRRSLTVELWSALGNADVLEEDGFRNDGFVFMTGLLGLARFAPLMVGLSIDVGSTENSENLLFGPVFGGGFDIVPGLRAEGLVAIGGHLVDSIGYYTSGADGVTGDRSAWLLQGGLRLGLSGRIGGDAPRIIIGGWVAVWRDLTSATRTLSYSGGFSEVWDVGGSIAVIAVRMGFEW